MGDPAPLRAQPAAMGCTWSAEGATRCHGLPGRRLDSVTHVRSLADSYHVLGRIAAGQPGNLDLSFPVNRLHDAIGAMID